MRTESIIRALLFVVFFSIGAAALGVSILCNDLIGYHHVKRQLEEEEYANKKLESLIADYNAVSEQVKSDPNLFKRIAPATLGVEPAEANTIYPKVTPEQSAAARKALSKEENYKKTQPTLPNWLARCGEPRRRIILFLAGAALILISFIFFCPVREPSPKEG